MGMANAQEKHHSKGCDEYCGKYKQPAAHGLIGICFSFSASDALPFCRGCGGAAAAVAGSNVHLSSP